MGQQCEVLLAQELSSRGSAFPECDCETVCGGVVCVHVGFRSCVRLTGVHLLTVCASVLACSHLWVGVCACVQLWDKTHVHTCLSPGAGVFQVCTPLSAGAFLL